MEAGHQQPPLDGIPPPSLPCIGAENANELTQLVQTMLNQMQSRFQGMSDNIINRIDEMGKRIDELEGSISDLVSEAQQDPDNNQAPPNRGN